MTAERPTPGRRALGQILIDTGRITEAQLAEGLRAAAVYGGRLGTNLVELGYIDERTLHAVLAAQHGVATLEIGAKPTPNALRLLPPQLCDELNILPITLDDGCLIVATSDPSRPGLVALAEATAGIPVQLVVAGEGLLFALMRSALGIERPLRYALVAAEARQAGRADLRAAPMRSILRDSAFSPVDGAVSDEEDILSDIVIIDALEEESLDAQGEDEIIELTAVVDDDATVFDAEIATGEFSFGPVDAPAADEAVQAAHARLGERLRPFSFEEAVLAIQTCSGRDELARAVLRFALWTYGRALIFSVQRGLVLGWDGLGNRVDRDLAAKLMIPVSAPSVFQKVYDSRRQYQGPLAEDPLNRLFMKILGGEWPRVCHVVPFTVGTRVVALLYADGLLVDWTQVHASEYAMIRGPVRRAFERFMARGGAASS